MICTNEDSLRRIETILEECLNWDDILERSEIQGISQRLYCNLLKINKDWKVPANVMDDLREKYLINISKNMLHFRELANILRSFNDLNIKIIVLKGAFLAQIIYKDIGLRPMNDIDLLIREEDLQMVEKALAELRYYVSSKQSNEILQTHPTKELHFVNQDTKVIIDIHWDIQPIQSQFRIDVDTLWEKAQLAKIDDIITLALSPENILQHLCLHIYNHMHCRGMPQAKPLRDYCDIAEVIKYYKDAINWNDLLQSSRDFGIEEPIYQGLSIASQYFEALLPLDVSNRLETIKSDVSVDNILRIRRNDCRVILSPEYNIRGAMYGKERKFNAYNWQEDLSFDLTEGAYKLLSKCDGKNTIRKLELLVNNKVMLYKYVDYFLNKKIILINSDVGKSLQTEQVPKASNGPFMRRIHWHLTGQCNLKCNHCYMSMYRCPSKDLDLKEIRELIKCMSKLNVLYVNLTGGEIFLRNDLNEIIKTLYDYRIGVKNINTNGTLIDKQILGTIRAYYPNVFFYVSLDGCKSSTHDTFRNSKGAFDKTIAGIRLLSECGFKVLINTSLTKLNKDEIEDIYILVKDLNISKWRISQPFPVGQWISNKQDLSVPLSEEKTIYENVLSLWEKEGHPIEIELGSAFRIQFSKYYMSRYNEDSYACGYYRDSLSILPNGDVIPCGALALEQMVCGNLREHTLSEIWMGHKMRAFKDLKIKDLLRYQENKKCVGCKFLSICGLGCRVRSLYYAKDIYHIDPILCELYTQNYEDMFNNFYERYSKLYEIQKYD
ncbi:MAG: nucleotidyltransferase family protein [Methanothrix sp.]|nr:nucleotidyltransferase family protein [Methanothrix sp.]MDD4446222.1 nucleotidyltransferase family protein [Methanothrix sp.]